MSNSRSSKWGSGLFENQADLDIIRGFTFEAEMDGKTMNTFLFPGDVKTWRKQLDAGTLDKLLDKYLPLTGGTKESAEKFTSATEFDYGKSPDYCLCVIGAVMMHLGCKIRPDFRQFLLKSHRHVGFSCNAAIQLGQALEVYEEGIPHNFRFKKNPSLFSGAETISTQDRLWDQFAGSQLTFGPEEDPESVAFARSVLSNLLKCAIGGENAYEPYLCGNCGRDKTENGSALLLCPDCGVKVYCSRKCLLAHRPTHKVVCEDHTYRLIGNGVKARYKDEQKKVLPVRESAVCSKCNAKLTEGVECPGKDALYCDVECYTAHLSVHAKECKSMRASTGQKKQTAVAKAGNENSGKILGEVDDAMQSTKTKTKKNV